MTRASAGIESRAFKVKQRNGVMTLGNLLRGP